MVPEPTCIFLPVLAAARPPRDTVPRGEVARVAVSVARARGGGRAAPAWATCPELCCAPPTPPRFLCRGLISNIAPRAAAYVVAFVLVVSARGRDGQGGRGERRQGPRGMWSGERRGFHFFSKR